MDQDSPEITAAEQTAQKLEGVLILRNSSLKLKTVVDNAVLQKCCISSENIS